MKIVESLPEGRATDHHEMPARAVSALRVAVYEQLLDAWRTDVAVMQ